jgi:N-acetylglucosaminyl-diphospho-decaprenol L-rhamnosyltransferase
MRANKASDCSVRSDRDDSPTRPAIPGLTSVVVVAADSGPLLRTCVDSVLMSSADVELILVDNASADGEPERAAEAHAGDERLRVLRNGANLGFGPACNRGATLARGDVLMFLNPDCVLQSKTVEGLRRYLDAHSEMGLLGVTVCDPDGTPARGIRRRDPMLARALVSMTGLARFEHRWPRLAGVEMPPAPASIPELENVEAISGACMTMPRRVFEQVDGFDEAYFLHVEDLDLCRRVRDVGYRVAIAHALHITHAQGSSSHHRALFVAEHKHRGMWRYFRKFDPAARNPFFSSCVRAGLWAHLIAIRALHVIGLRRRPRETPKT